MNIIKAATLNFIESSEKFSLESTEFSLAYYKVLPPIQH